ncbi:MAG: magnesium-translocating P-type ATPase [Nakamurella sp.]
MVDRIAAGEASVTAGAAVRSAAISGAQVLTDLHVTGIGLSGEEAQSRIAVYGPNAVVSHHASALLVLWHQVRSPLLALLLAAALASAFVGEASDAVIIAAIVALSVGLGFTNEYRAERAAHALHSQIHHFAVAMRDNSPVQVDVTDLVPGDVVSLRLGNIVPADIRLLSTVGLECDEAILTGESMPVLKQTDSVPQGSMLADLTSCALMGTVVHAGSGTGVVVATGAATEFGAIAAGLNLHQLETEFQIGLRHFSMLLVYVAAALTGSIFVANVLLHKPVIDALLFSLAIAVGITPQLLPAVVSTSLATGSRRMSKRKVLVKRLVCIEDLGDVDVLFTDKTGTLTEGRISYLRPIPAGDRTPDQVTWWGLVCTESGGSGEKAAATGGLDEALWRSPATASQQGTVAAATRLAMLPFDHDRRMVSVLVRQLDGVVTLVTKGAPEAVFARCQNVPAAAQEALGTEYAAGNRVVAVATRPSQGAETVTAADEAGLDLQGLLVFLDPVKKGAAVALARLAALGITVKVITGDSPVVASKVCNDLGLDGTGALTGADLDTLNDEQLAASLPNTTIFARVGPEQKARIVRLQRTGGHDVAFLGDGVNDALALHAADVGISVDTATDVAKDAADVILLDKDLAVLADGVAEGRRIFANTMKYVLMGTSSNFGNMFSAAAASLFLSFLPMLPSQILLNNILYDSSQLAIPSDTVDEEQLRRPSHWNIGLIRRFMFIFGPISSLFDFATFAIMLWVLHAGPAEFRSGWFVESLATQTLVIFVIRTRRVPFTRSRPGMALAIAALGVVALGAILPSTRLGEVLGFTPLPGLYWAALAVLAVCYLVLIEGAKALFFRHESPASGTLRPQQKRRRRQRRRAGRFSTGGHALSPK